MPDRSRGRARSRLPCEIKASALALGILLGAGLHPATGGPDRGPEETARERTLRVATAAFERFKDGLSTGQWDGFLEMLTDDFTFFFPTGKWHGGHRGRDKAREFFTYVSQVFPEGSR